MPEPVHYCMSTFLPVRKFRYAVRNPFRRRTASQPTPNNVARMPVRKKNSHRPSATWMECHAEVALCGSRKAPFRTIHKAKGNKTLHFSPPTYTRSEYFCYICAFPPENPAHTKRDRNTRGLARKALSHLFPEQKKDYYANVLSAKGSKLEERGG